MTVQQPCGDRHTIYVGMGGIAISRQSGDELLCLGLGSCVAICLYHPQKRIGLMAHVVLPNSGGKSVDQPGKFADTAIPEITHQLTLAGIRGRETHVVLCGGASIFRTTNGTLDIGQRNIVAVRTALQNHGFTIVKEEVGGTESRTIGLCVSTGAVRLRTLRGGETSLTRLGAV